MPGLKYALTTTMVGLLLFRLEWTTYDYNVINCCLLTVLAVLTCLAILLGKQLERTLLGGIAGLGKPGKRLLASGMGLAAHNAALVHHQILLVEAAGRVLRRTVPDLNTRTNRRNIGHFFYI